MVTEILQGNLQVALGPLKGKTEVKTKPIPLPALKGWNLYDFRFADWDGDGAFDLLFAASRKDEERLRQLLRSETRKE